MSDIIMEEQNLYDIADAIREKLGVSDEYLPSEMAGAVRQISGSAVQSDWDEDDTTADDYIKNKPTNVSDFNNDSGFVTSTVNNLVNYYKKTETYTQAEVDALISAIVTLHIESVSVLPTTDISTTTIYLVPSADPQAQNVKDEYINTDGTSAGWELIGSTAIDLTGYVTDAELTTALADYTTTANLTTLLAGKQDTISDLSTIRSGASAGATAYQKPSDGIPKTDLASSVQTSLEKADSALQSHQPAVKYDTASQGLTDTQKANARTNIGVPDFGEIVSTDPYTFRQGLGTMADMEIVGGTVAWNQLVNTKSYSNGSNTDSRTSIYFRAQFIGTNTNLVSETISNNGVYEYVRKAQTDGRLVLKHSGGTYDLTFATTPSALTVNHVVFLSIAFNGTNPSVTKGLNTDNMQVIDLTQVFGTEIADYIYSLEHANKGAGVAWFRKLFPKDYYVYDAGSLQSVRVSGRNAVWKNLFDENSNLSTYYINQDNTRRAGYIVPLIAGIYTISAQFGDSDEYIDACLEKNGTFTPIGRVVSTTTLNNYTFTVSNGENLLIFDAASAETRLAERRIKKAKIQVEIGSTATAYEPYTSKFYPISSPDLRGVFKLSDGQLVADGDKYSPDGTVTRQYGIVDLGTLNWTADGNRAGIFYTNSLNGSVKNDGSGICSIYEVRSNMGVNSIQNMQLSTVASYGRGYIFAKNTSYTDATTFKTAMSGVMLVYELATPTTESAQPFQNPQRAYLDGMEEFTDGLTRDVMVPVGNHTTYQLSKALMPVEDYTDGVVRVMQGDVDGKADKDMISDAWVSGQAYSVRDYCIYGDTIYRCIQTVTQGTAILPTNTSYWTPVKIAAEIASLNSRLVRVTEERISANVTSYTTSAKISAGIFVIALMIWGGGENSRMASIVKIVCRGFIDGEPMLSMGEFKENTSGYLNNVTFSLNSSAYLVVSKTSTIQPARVSVYRLTWLG